MADAKSVAVVTGAASGIGKAVCERLAADGIDVVAVDRDTDRLFDVPAERTHVLDVSSPEGRADFVAGISTIDFLVNAAGILRLQQIDDVTPGDWDKVMDVNAKAVFFLLQALMPKVRSGGAVVNVASTAGKTASTIEAAVYNASKAAVIAMTKTFAYAFADAAVRVNCVCPGTVATPMGDDLTIRLADLRGVAQADVEAGYASRVPLGRRAEAAEVAGVVRFLLSDDARYMTGQAINISGGLVMY